MNPYEICEPLRGNARTEPGISAEGHQGNGGEAQSRDFLTRSFGGKNSLVRLSNDTILLDRFRIKRHLGDGRFAAVYLAEDKLRESEIALKIIEVGPCSEPLSKAQLKRETDAYSRMSNFENVIRIYDLHYAPWGGTGLLLLAMEYAEGGTFRDWLIEHAHDMETRQATGLEYFKQACRGVIAAHSADIVNLDLKPENLLFSNAVLRVADFGTARWGQILQQHSTAISELPSIEVGTPVYMSPEHFMAAHPDDLDARADIYSLGIILYELHHPKCRPPFGGSSSRLRELHLTLPAPRLIESGDDMARIIAQCLAKEPVDRYQRVQDLLDDLENGYGQNKAHNSSEESEERVPLSDIEATWEEASFCFSNEDFTAARRLTEEVLGMDPEHTQAQRLKAEIEKRFDQARRLYKEIQDGLDSLGLDQLIDLLKRAVDIYPNHPEGHLLQSRLHSKSEQYREYWEKASQCLSRQDFDEAVLHLKAVLLVNPTDTAAKELLEKLGTRSTEARRLYEAIEEGLQSGDDLNGLVKMTGEAVSIYPNYPGGRVAQFKLAQRSRQFRQAMEKGSTALRLGSWEMALKWFSQVQNLCPNSVELEEIIERLSQITEARRKIDDAVLHKRFGEAQHLARFVDLKVNSLRQALPGVRE